MRGVERRYHVGLNFLSISGIVLALIWFWGRDNPDWAPFYSTSQPPFLRIYITVLFPVEHHGIYLIYGYR